MNAFPDGGLLIETIVEARDVIFAGVLAAETEFVPGLARLHEATPITDGVDQEPFVYPLDVETSRLVINGFHLLIKRESNFNAPLSEGWQRMAARTTAYLARLNTVDTVA